VARRAVFRARLRQQRQVAVCFFPPGEKSLVFSAALREFFLLDESAGHAEMGQCVERRKRIDALVGKDLLVFGEGEVGLSGFEQASARCEGMV